MPLKVYAYKGCETCRRALRFLEKSGVQHQVLAIRDTPPSVAELKAALAASGGQLKKLFNTSGQDYKALGMKDKLPKMSESEALALLAKTGNLVKRPFVIGASRPLVGFDEAEWRQVLET